MNITPVIPESRGPEIHRAGHVVVDSDKVIENGCIQVENGRITDVGVYNSKIMGGSLFDHGPGFLIPSLVNAHTHLELSAMKGKLNIDIGFQGWVKELLEVRDRIGTQGLIDGIAPAVREFVNSGSFVVGDISSLGIVEKILKQTVLSGVIFREYLGNTIPESPQHVPLQSLNLSWAGHAPHTTSPELLVNLKDRSRKNDLPFSIHLSESVDEMEFIITGKGHWAEFLTCRGIDFSSWNIPCSSPVKHLDNFGILDSQTLVVHLIRADRDDLRILKDSQVNVCLCPRSNNALHKVLPPVDLMMAEGLNLCLGTDSLASTESLSVFDEMRFLSSQFPHIPPRVVFSMATINGAKALGCDSVFGSIEPGKSGKIIYLPDITGNNHHIFERLVS